jgi:hypothetical protein
MATYNGYSKEACRLMNDARKMKREEKRQHLLDSMGGSLQDREVFVDTLAKYFYERREPAYHYFIHADINEEFLRACQQLNCKLSKYHCLCETEAGKLHRHYVVWLPNPKNVKKPTQMLTRKLEVILFSKGIQKKRAIIGKLIKNRVHLVHTILYIMTQKTGKHIGNVKACMHFGHQEPTVMPDREVQQIFKEECLDKRIPEYAKERKEEWQKYQLAVKIKKARTEHEKQSSNFPQLFN